MDSALRMVSNIPESDIFENIQVLSKTRMCLKSCLPWPPSFPWMFEYSHSIMTFKCIPFSNGQSRYTVPVSQATKQVVLISIKLRLNHE